jgi:hypothetical protein
MFVCGRPSRTRAERAIPGDRTLDAFDRALIGAHGAALALVAAYLSRAVIVEADEGRLHAWNPRRDGRRSESYRGRCTWGLSRNILDSAVGGGLVAFLATVSCGAGE